MYRELLSQNSLLNVKKQEYYENEQVSEEGKYKFAEDNKTCEEFLHAWGITIFKIYAAWYEGEDKNSVKLKLVLPLQKMEWLNENNFKMFIQGIGGIDIPESEICSR